MRVVRRLLPVRLLLPVLLLRVERRLLPVRLLRIVRRLLPVRLLLLQLLLRRVVRQSACLHVQLVAQSKPRAVWHERRLLWRHSHGPSVVATVASHRLLWIPRVVALGACVSRSLDLPGLRADGVDGHRRRRAGKAAHERGAAVGAHIREQPRLQAGGAASSRVSACWRVLTQAPAKLCMRDAESTMHAGKCCQGEDRVRALSRGTSLKPEPSGRDSKLGRCRVSSSCARSRAIRHDPSPCGHSTRLFLGVILGAQ